MTRTTWTAQAETLADVQEIGDDIALLAGRCRATGLDPRSFAAVMGAAMTLGSRPWHVMECPYSSDEELIGDLLEEDARLWSRQNAYIRLRSDVAAARGRAAALFTAAACSEPPDRPMMAYWAAVEGDCDTALEVLASLPRRLSVARAALMRAPGELGETYQAVYDVLAHGRVMPHDGRWLTGEETQC